MDLKLRIARTAARIATRLNLADTTVVEAIKDQVLRSLQADLEGHAVRVDGFDMFLNPRDRTSAMRYLTNNYEPFETEIVRRIPLAGATALDIGANIGYYSLLTSAAVGPKGRVYAFEPESRNFGLLEKNLALNHATNVTAFRLAVSDAPGTGTLVLSPTNMGDHRLAFGASAGAPRAADSQVVEVDSLDRRLERERVTEVDFIKLDVQGHEHRVLVGARRLLTRQAHRLVILMELEPEALRAAGTNPEALLTYLRGFDFQVLALDVEHRAVIPLTAGSSTGAGRTFYNVLLVGSDRTDVLRAMGLSPPD